MRRATMLLAAVFVSAAGCGGSSDSTEVGPGGTGIFSATLGGASWTAASPVYLINTSGVNISGYDASQTTNVTLTFLASAPGTYSLAFGQNVGGLGTVSKTNGQGWSTVHTGGTGSVVVTTLTAHHAVGTFSFDAIGSSATDVLHVTNGKFDITF
jgi:hypothetical protein